MPLCFEDFTQQLGYVSNPSMKAYWLPGKALQNSLKADSDHDINIMVSVLENFNNSLF